MQNIIPDNGPDQTDQSKLLAVSAKTRLSKNLLSITKYKKNHIIPANTLKICHQSL